MGMDISGVGRPRSAPRDAGEPKASGSAKAPAGSAACHAPLHDSFEPTPVARAPQPAPGRGPSVVLEPKQIPAGPKTVARNPVSREGFVSSVQATRLTGKAVPEGGLDAAAGKILADYFAAVPRLSFGTVQSTLEADGRAVYRVLGKTLVELGPPEGVPGQPGAVRRTAIGGALIPLDCRGRAYFECKVANDGPDLLVQMTLGDYRSPVRGSRPDDGARTALFLGTHCAIHSWVGERFLSSLSR